MRTFLLACIGVLWSTSITAAQMSVNPDWRERNGLTVASTQTVIVPAKYLRCFTTLKAIESDPPAAILKLKDLKKAAKEALTTCGISEKDVSMTATRILETEWKTDAWRAAYGLTGGLLLPSNLESGTALSHVSFDIHLEATDPDELAALPYVIFKRLKEHNVFEACDFKFLFIGELEDSQMKDAYQKAFAEASSDAKAMAMLSGRSLGKLAAMTPEVNGRWWGWSAGYDGHSWDHNAALNPLSQFKPKENEVFGADPNELKRSCSLELRYSLD